MRWARVVGPAVVGPLLCIAPRAASAATPASKCIDANSAAQDARASARFNSAREALRVCMDPACPRRVRDDCVERFEELERAQPTIILSAKDGRGRDLAAVTVTMDGKPLASKLDGVAVRVDPGAHDFVFSAPGEPDVAVNAIIREAQRERTIEALIPQDTPATTAVAAPANMAPNPEVAAAPKPTPAVEPEPARAPLSGWSAWKVGGVATGATGVVALGVGAVFGGLAFRSRSQQNGACGVAISAPEPGDCSPAGVAASNSLHTQATLSSIFMIGGGVLAAGGAVLYFTAPASGNVGVGLRNVTIGWDF